MPRDAQSYFASTVRLAVFQMKLLYAVAYALGSLVGFPGPSVRRPLSARFPRGSGLSARWRSVQASRRCKRSFVAWKRYSRYPCNSTATMFDFKTFPRLVINGWYCNTYSINWQWGGGGASECDIGADILKRLAHDWTRRRYDVCRGANRYVHGRIGMGRLGTGAPSGGRQHPGRGAHARDENCTPRQGHASTSQWPPLVGPT